MSDKHVEVTRDVFCLSMDTYTNMVLATARDDLIIYTDVTLGSTLGWVDSSSMPNKYFLLEDLLPNKKPDNDVSGFKVKQYDVEWD